ncbi:hypothetical protein [Ferrimonas sp. YFM]|uniref:hypothetical protein n=1 Tax=Ferrimonas sp. YFM TaxID=3028878 RepID=UPI0025726077|nr:hypothetical protein [Ferrimonas sp. YFM]BDY06746.1 hypothetical protein F0521_37870 [Ferrimonas sp. YFM]
MSVINKMLKDLDQQQRQRILQPNLASATLPHQGQNKRSGWWWILLLSLVLTLVIWVGLWPRLQVRLADNSPQQGVEAVNPMPVVPTEAPAVASEPGTTPDVEAAPIEAQPEPVPQPEPEALAHSTVAELPPEIKAAPGAPEPLAKPKGVTEPVTLDLASTQTNGVEEVETTDVDEPLRSPQTEETAQVTEPKPKRQVMVVAPAKLSHKQQAQALYQQGKEQQDTDALRQALALDASLHQARVLLAQRLAVSDPGEALVILAEASRRWPGELDYPLTAAEVALGSGAREQAALWLGQLNQQPLSLPMMARRADLARELSMLTLAVNDYRGLANADPRQGRWWLGLAHSLDRLGNYGEAASAYRQALSTRTLSDSARRYIEQRLQQLGDAG